MPNLKKPYILWFSDIHYSNMYNSIPIDGKNGFDFLWDKFIEKIGELHRSHHKFSHIIISGDLIMSGDSSEVINFAKRISKLYETVFKMTSKPKLIICPGNHDVSRSYLTESYIKFRKAGNNTIEDFYKFLIGTTTEINSLKTKMFKDYKNFYDCLIDLNIVFDSSSQNDNLFFNYYDDEYNLLFRIINSSSNSHGDGVHSLIEIILEKLIADNGNMEAVKKLIELSTKVKEQGNQIYLAEPLDENNFIPIINNSDPIVISIAHHPIHEWLTYSQIYDTRESSEINQIYRFSHLHLSSHEHIDPSQYYLYFKDLCLNLKSGKFCDSELGRIETSWTNDMFKEVFCENWFSTLLISPEKMEVQHSNYKFQFTDIANSTWIDLSPLKVHKLRSKEMNFDAVFRMNSEIEELNMTDLLNFKVRLDEAYNKLCVLIDSRLLKLIE